MNRKCLLNFPRQDSIVRLDCWTWTVGRKECMYLSVISENSPLVLPIFIIHNLATHNLILVKTEFILKIFFLFVTPASDPPPSIAI